MAGVYQAGTVYGDRAAVVFKQRLRFHGPGIRGRIRKQARSSTVHQLKASHGGFTRRCSLQALRGISLAKSAALATPAIGCTATTRRSPRPAASTRGGA